MKISFSPYKKLLLSFLGILLLALTNLEAQDFDQDAPVSLPINWPILAQVKYKSFQDPSMSMGAEKPEFGIAVRRLNEKKVNILGYVIPLDTEGENYVLSAFPNSTCFFCGKAGMESMVELKLAYPQKFEMDSHLRFEGKLLLNSDPYGLMYILKDAKLLED